MKVFSINKNELQFGSRLIPAFYYYEQIVNDNNDKKGIKQFVLEKHATVSDGEHSHVQRNNKNGIRYLYGRNIKEGVINFDPISDDPYITIEDYNKFTRCHIKENDVLISIYGTIGKSSIYKSEYVGKAGIPRHISNITLKDDCPVSEEFLISYFRSLVGKWRLHNITTGNIQQLLSLKNIKKLKIPIPSKTFHEEITSMEKEALSLEIKALKEIENAKKKLYDIINIDFTEINKPKYFSAKKSDVTNSLWTPKCYSPLYLNSIKAIKASFNVLPLEELVTIKKGNEVGSANYNKFTDKKKTDIPFVRTSDIVNYEIDLYPDYYIPFEIYSELEQDMNPGDLLYNNDGKVGLVALTTSEDRVIIQSHIKRLRLKKYAIKNHGLTQEYIFLVLSTKEIGLYQAERYTVIQSTIPTIGSRISQIEIPILPKKDIEKLSNQVSKAYKFKEKRKNLLKQVESKMNEYFL